MMITLEVFVAASQDERLHYRRLTAALDEPERDPDAAAAQLVREALGGDSLRLLHSTSWRHEPGGIVLTYIAVADALPQADAAVTGAELSLARSDDPCRPRPPAIGHRHVLSHALRHLAFLAHPYASPPAPADAPPLPVPAAMRAFLANLPPALAGRLI